MGRPKKIKPDNLSLTDILARLKSFSLYKAGWHNGEGQIITQDIIDTSAIFVSCLMSKGIYVLVSPTIEGGITVESSFNNNNDFIIDVYANGNLDISSLNESTKSLIDKKSINAIIDLVSSLGNN
jgi:hypothetical protein